MSSIPQCRAEGGPATCIDEQCPQKLYHMASLNAAAANKDFEAFAAAKEKSKGSFSRVKLPSDFKKIAKQLYPNVLLTLTGDGRDGGFVGLSMIRIPDEERNLGQGTKIMSELVKAADKNGWNLSLTPDGGFGSSKLRLEVFYRRFGFRPNKGRAKDFATMDTMIRYPMA